jgi:hypothetical protein
LHHFHRTGGAGEIHRAIPLPAPANYQRNARKLEHCQETWIPVRKWDNARRPEWFLFPADVKPLQTWRCIERGIETAPFGAVPSLDLYRRNVALADRNKEDSESE